MSDGSSSAPHPKAVEMVPLSNLKAYPSNARTHSKKQIRQIAASIERFGFNNPILVDDSNQIVAGHGRAKAAELLKMSAIPVLRLSHLTGAEKRAYILADNKLAENAGWDRNLLGLEFQYLSGLDIDFDVSLTGFELPEIDILIGELDAANSNEPADAPIPLPAGPAVTRLGDIWQIGNHRLICGDSTERDTYQRLLGDVRAQLVFTDAPYNVPISGHVGGLGTVQHREFAMASGEM
jgi:ParB-like nuclease family protein